MKERYQQIRKLNPIGTILRQINRHNRDIAKRNGELERAQRDKAAVKAQDVWDTAVQMAAQFDRRITYEDSNYLFHNKPDAEPLVEDTVDVLNAGVRPR